jgi:D-alanyl-D-alanine endopeptidase (penicillin-binding protein 7)
MPSSWNSAPRHAAYSAAFRLLILLMFIMGTNLEARAAPRNDTQSGQKAGNAKKTVVKKNATPQPRIMHRQNLRPVSYSQPGVVSGIGGGLDGNTTDDIIIKRAPEAAPLTNQAMLQSEVAFVQDLNTSDILYDKNSDEVRPIASISKLMTALVIAESGQSMSQMLRISDADVDRLRHSRSRLSVGTELSRADMLHLALMSSENRAAHALGRYYPGGMPAFVRAMNDKARALGMRTTRFVEPTGLASENVASPRDLVKLLQAAGKHPLIHRYTTDETYEVKVARGRQLVYNNTNRLVKNSDWDIKVSKTGFINEAGECLVMLTRIDNRDVAIVLLNSSGRYSRIGDAVRIRTLVENTKNIAML